MNCSRNKDAKERREYNSYIPVEDVAKKAWKQFNSITNKLAEWMLISDFKVVGIGFSSLYLCKEYAGDWNQQYAKYWWKCLKLFCSA